MGDSVQGDGAALGHTGLLTHTPHTPHTRGHTLTEAGAARLLGPPPPATGHTGALIPALLSRATKPRGYFS